MNVPRYWARVEGVAPGAGGHPIGVWGWSAESHGEAQRLAHQRLTQLLDHLREHDGWPKSYAYGLRPRREEILEEVRDGSGGVHAFLSRVAYGSVVLNAARVLFVDVDVPWPTLRQRIGAIFRSNDVTPETQALDRIRTALRDDRKGSYRIYRTAAGFRVVATDPVFEPGSREATRLMETLGADPAYLQLCRVQECFRARLTAKPWRCGIGNPPGRFPREPEQEAAFVQWLAKYDRAAESRAVCRFVDAIGWNRVHDDARDLVRLHDEWTGVESGKPLA